MHQCVFRHCRMVLSFVTVWCFVDAVLAQDKMDHLLKAAAHLEQAGFPEKAAEVRQIAAKESEVDRQRLLQQKLDDLSQLQREIEQLRRTLDATPQIVLRLKVLEFSPGKLQKMGLPLVSIQQLLDNDTPTALVDETGSLGEFIEFLHKQGLMNVICEPTLATVADRPVSVSLGERIAGGSARTDAAKKESPGACEYGARLDCTPHIAKDGRLDLEIRLCQPGRALARSSDSERRVPTEGDTALEIDTRVGMESGQRVILCGRRCGGSPEEEIGVLVLLTAELVGAPQDSTGAE